MKYFIASDIHGSAFWCEKMLNAYKKENANRMILLGDILYHGPRNDLPQQYSPKQVIAMLNPLKDEIYCVRGNCEAEVDQMVLNFPCLAEYMLLCEKGRMIFITHGHVFNSNNLPPHKEGDILLHGHTHVPACQNTDNMIYMNPGSVSIPKNDSWHGYMILEDGVFTWKDFDVNTHNSYTI